MFRLNWQYGLCGAVAAASAFGVSHHALAQSGQFAQSGQIEEVIVTAEKRSEKLSDVPMSIAALSGDQLTDLGVKDPSNLTKVVPGFSYQKSVFGTPVYSIRGIGFYANAATAGPTVPVYIDQVPLPYSEETRGAALDLERVEILKGPQGTLFGENSTGGAVNYIPVKPTDVFEAGASLSYGQFNDVDATAFVSGPLSDQLEARFAIRHERADGWQKSTTRPGDTLGRKDFTNGRLLLDWTPRSDLSFELNVSGWHDGSESQAAQYQGFYPSNAVTPTTQFIADAMLASPLAANNAQSADWTAGADLSRDDNFYLVSLRGDWDIQSNLTLTSITAYSKLQGLSPIDVSGTDFANFLDLSHKTMLSSVSQELRLAGTNGRFKWMIGGNYQSDVAKESAITLAYSTHGAIGPYYFAKFGQRTREEPKTVSVFGSADFQLTDTLTLQGSIRYTSQKRDFEGCAADGGAGDIGVSTAVAFSILSGNVVAPGACITIDPVTHTQGLAYSKLNENNVPWRVSLNWKANPDTLLYANVTQGFKAGSYSLIPAVFANQFTPVTQERVLAYEGGAKTSFADRRIQLDGAIFYYDYTDKQLLGYVVTPPFGSLPQLINIPKSKVYGVELNATVLPIDSLRVTGGLTYVASRVDADPVAPAEARNPFGVLTSFVGESFPDTPKWQAMVDAEYDFPVVEGCYEGYLGGSLTHRSGTYAAFGRSPEFAMKSYTLLDLRAGVRSDDGHWTAQVWGRNVTNEYYWVNVSHLTDYVSRLAGMPVTYGATVSYRY